MAGLKQIWKGKQPTLHAFLLLLPLFLMLPVVILLWQQQFDGLYGQDAYAYYNYATGALRQSLRALEPLAPFYWPPGYPLLTALVSFITGPTPLAGQIVSLVCGGLVVVFTGLLAEEVCGQGISATNYTNYTKKPRKIREISGIRGKNNPWSVVASLVVALTPQLWQSSAVVMPDTTALASATLGVWALARYRRVGRGRWLALAAGAVSFAVLTRLAYAPLALPCAMYALWALARRPGRARLWQAAAGVVVALVVLSPLLISLIQTSDFGDRRSLEKSDVADADASRAPFLGNLGDVPWNMDHALQNEFVTPSGRQQYRLPNGLYYALTPAHRYFFTPLLIPFLLIGLWQVRKSRNVTQGLLLLGWPAVIYVSLVGYPFQNFRFTLGFLPPLAILVAGGVQRVASNLHEFARMNERNTWREIRGNWRQFGAKAIAYLPLAGALLWMAYGGWTLSESFMARKEGELATVRWVRQQVEPRAQLYTFAVTLAFEQYSDLQVHDLYGLDPSQLGALLESNGSTASRAPAYLLLDVQNIETQWAQHAPGRNYRWLAEEVGLTRLGQRRQYTLFRVEQGNNHDPP